MFKKTITSLLLTMTIAFQSLPAHSFFVVDLMDGELDDFYDIQNPDPVGTALYGAFCFLFLPVCVFDASSTSNTASVDQMISVQNLIDSGYSLDEIAQIRLGQEALKVHLAENRLRMVSENSSLKNKRHLDLEKVHGMTPEYIQFLNETFK